MRILALCALNSLYAPLWTECWDPAFAQERWTKDDSRLPADTFTKLTGEWSRETPLRTDYARRQALVEIDVLVARALGLTVDELCAIYRIQFPVLRQNESDTWYDQTGRIIFTCSKGLPGVGFDRPAWNELKDLPAGHTTTRTVVDAWLPDDRRSEDRGQKSDDGDQKSEDGDRRTDDGGRKAEGGGQGVARERVITYRAPFDRCDREADYRTAWAAFDARGAK